MQPDPLPLFPPEFPRYLRRFSRHITKVQTRHCQNGAPVPLFGNSSAHQPPKGAHPYPPCHDDYDLNNYPVMAFRPHLLAANIERIFVIVVPLWSAGISELDRLTTWREPTRTACWAVTYSICWWYGLVLPAWLAMLACLSIWPKSAAAILFPHDLTSGSSKLPGSPSATDLQGEVASSEEDLAEAAAVAATSTLVAEAGSPSTLLETEVTSEESMLAEAEVPSPKGETSSTTKATKRGITGNYKPVVYKYGGAIQNITGAIADGHERVRNLFLRRFIPQPQPLVSKSSSTPNLTPLLAFLTQWELEPNIRLAVLILLVMILSLSLSTETFGRCITLLIGFALFVLNPLQARFKAVKDLLDPNQGIFRGVPTDRAWILATLRHLNERQHDGLEVAIKLIDKPQPPPVPKRPLQQRTVSLQTDCEAVSNASLINTDRDSCASSLNSTSASLASAHSSLINCTEMLSTKSTNDHCKQSKRDKLMRFAKKMNRVTEQGTQLLSLDFSSFSSNRTTCEASYPHQSSESSDHSSICPSSEAAMRSSFLRKLSKNSRPSHPTGISQHLISQGLIGASLGSPPAQEPHLSRTLLNCPASLATSIKTSFFCYYGNLPGQLTIHTYSNPSSFGCSSVTGAQSRRPQLSFQSALGQTFKSKKASLIWPLTQVIGMRKTSLVNLAGVWGGIDCLQILARSQIHTPNHHHSDGENGDSSGGFDPGSTTKESVKVTSHMFKNVTKRDEAFLRILVLKDWDFYEDPGWVTF